ncbi:MULTISPECIES: hypothetical protein [Acinetobacter calcoaceticus/baumannii complex]|uniref:hypothetical protein n=1 Tax=Acinetobacter calcoaceticus/baumannii complex TaxID=909768 RepID=UPI000708083A|nr:MULTISPECIES: hypothetical protein [Acinetobacter calcoaceticus/baumannii complex]HAV4233405.1 hypothetical protein [Acinetobacter baumannii ATCC 17978]EHU2374009.1 hypothetical protein [Acinetobacter baumannii]EHU2749609.1 hypothetical protein [Acinetobacter baumannii]EKW2153847.1 hypothetical protein [Acinetobacter baumannii]KQD32966.1 hypothetical protein APD13_05585 [Acinetobacter pittii]
MSINREAIFMALFDLLKNIDGFVTAERRLRHWSDVPDIEQPYLCLAQGQQSVAQGSPATGVKPKWTLYADIYLYARTTGEQVPSSVLNPLVDAIEAALQPEFPEIEKCQTLNSLVTHCWIDGTIETDEGTLGDQAVAVIPISILVN